MRFKLPYHVHNMSIVLAVTVCITTASGWFIGRSDDFGSRPLAIIWGSDPQMYDPHNTSHPTAQSIFRHACEPLFYEDFTGELRGLLAEDPIEYASDGQSVTIRLRPDIRFHDGALLNAQAVKSSFEWLQRQGVSPLLNDLRSVRINAHTDQQTVTFHLPSPDYEFVRLVLTNSYAAIVSSLTQTSTAPGFVACTGTYQFVPEQYQPNRSLTLARVKNYHTPPHYLPTNMLHTFHSYTFS